MNTKTIKIFIAAILAISIAMLTMPMTLAAPVSGECAWTGQITWSFDSSTGELKLEGSGEMTIFHLVDNNSDDIRYNTPWCEYLDEIKKVTVSEGITKITRGVFAQAVNLTDVSLPTTLKELNYGAFYNCTSLKNINLSNTCITDLQESTFEMCTSLESIVIPSTVEDIGNWAFKDCKSLKTVRFSGDSLDYIGRGIFKNCESLENITIPGNARCISSLTFDSCKSLKNISLPNTVTEIDTSAFWGCNSLENIYYSGSEEEWNNITKITASVPGFGYQESKEFDNATIHFNSDVDAGSLSSGDASSDGAEAEDKAVENGNDTLIIMLIAGGAVLVAVAGVAIAIVIVKKRK